MESHVETSAVEEESTLVTQPRPQGHLRFQDGEWVRRRPWRRAGHVTTKLANCEPAAILKQSKSPIFLETRDLLFARVFFLHRRSRSKQAPNDKEQKEINESQPIEEG